MLSDRCATYLAPKGYDMPGKGDVAGYVDRIYADWTANVNMMVQISRYVRRTDGGNGFSNTTEWTIGSGWQKGRQAEGRVCVCLTTVSAGLQKN